LYNTEYKRDEAKKSLDKCDKCDITEEGEGAGAAIVKGYASVAKRKLGDSSQSGSYDWYNWWFGHGIHRIAFALALITALIAIASPLILIPFFVIDPAIGEYFINHNATGLKDTITKNITTEASAGFTIIVAIIVGMLLLPSLQTFKLGPVEMETATITAGKNVELKTADILRPEIFKMPLGHSYKPQYFVMPLKYQRRLDLARSSKVYIEMLYIPMPRTPFYIIPHPMPEGSIQNPIKNQQ
jgi:hypothetical protein